MAKDGKKKKETRAEREPTPNAARKWIEEIAEYYISERFAPVCEDPSEFAAAKVERWTDGPMHRIVISPDLIDREQLGLDTLKADLKYLTELVEANPKGFKELANALGDVEKLTQCAFDLGLYEEKFKAARGGLGWLLIIPVVLILTGCTDQEDPQPVSRYCGAPHPRVDGVLCNLRRHNGGMHRNNAVSGGPYTWR